MAKMKGPDRVRAALDAASLECGIRTLPDSTAQENGHMNRDEILDLSLGLLIAKRRHYAGERGPLGY